MKTAYIIGNCQVKSLASTMNYFSEDVNFKHFQIHGLDSKNSGKIISEKCKAINEEADFVLTFWLSDKFQELAAERIRQTFDNKTVFFITNLFFRATIPI